MARGGGEAIDIAIKTARHAKQQTQDRLDRQGLSRPYRPCGLRPAIERFSKLFLSDRPDEFIQVPFNDLNAMEDALRGSDVAAVHHGDDPGDLRLPDAAADGYLTGVKTLCERYDALYIADEVQTGLMRTGEMWGYQRYGVQPDIVVTGQGHLRRHLSDRLRGGARADAAAG